MKISVVIPAHNEQEFIGAAVASSRASLQGYDYEILVVADACSDATVEIANEAGAKVFEVDLRQISRVRNAGAQEAAGDLLVFLDADTLLSPELVSAALEAVEQGAVGGSACIRFDRSDSVFGWFLGSFFGWVCRLFSLAAGCFVFCDRQVFERVGGFDEKVFATEEWLFSQALKKQGRFVIVGPRVTTSARKLSQFTPWQLASELLRTSLGGFRRPSRLWYARPV